MAANTNPIFTLGASIPITANVSAANTATDGTGTVTTVISAGGNGTWFRGVGFKALGTNNATVARIFVNNGASNATATNNAMIGELAMPATTASNSTAIGPDFYWPSWLKFLPSTYRIQVCYGTAPTGGIVAIADTGDF